MKSKTHCTGFAAAGGLIIPARNWRNSARNSARVSIGLRGPATRLSEVEPPAQNVRAPSLMSRIEVVAASAGSVVNAGKAATAGGAQKESPRPWPAALHAPRTPREDGGGAENAFDAGPAPVTGGIFMPGLWAAPCRECRGYNTRKGKKRARHQRVFSSRRQPVRWPYMGA
jgi:hypothetical protein